MFQKVNKYKYLYVAIKSLLDYYSMNQYDKICYKQLWVLKTKSNSYISNDEYIELVNNFITKKVKKPTTEIILNITKSATFVMFLEKKVEKFFNFWNHINGSSNEFYFDNFNFNDNIKKVYLPITNYSKFDLLNTIKETLKE
jgi:hypothetical protein